MKKFALGFAIILFACTTNAMASTTLNILAAGTLAFPFKQIDAAFQKKYPDINVEPRFGGSVKMVKMVTELHQPADVIAVADYSVIPKYLFGDKKNQPYTNWYVGFAGNAITFVYTENSKGADQINSSNWYKILSQPGVQIGRSNPDTDPSGYQTVQMLNLASQYYGAPELEQHLLANAPISNMRDTETDLISALQVGQIDYLAIYHSDALQHHFKYLDLPAQINLSNPAYSSIYAKGNAMTKNGLMTGKPIVYAITILNNSAHKDAAQKYVAFLLGPVGQTIMKKNGFIQIDPAFAMNRNKMPKSLQKLVKSWPKT